jgi:hypothetical protein
VRNEDGTSVFHGVLNIPEGESGDVSVEHRFRPAGTVLKTANARTLIFGQDFEPEEVSFESDTRWHVLKEDGGVWMTDDPIEQVQADVAIHEFMGSVLVGGLGLGYVTTALANNPEVDDILVVEINPNVIDVVWPHLGDLVHEKATIETGDIKEYLETLPISNFPSVPHFDFAFYDTWRSDGERTLHEEVLPLRKASVGRVDCVKCWNEDVMRGQLVMSLVTQLECIKAGIGGMTIREMATFDPKGNHFQNWAVPFWQAVDDKIIPESKQKEAAVKYGSWYGDPQMRSRLDFVLKPRPLVYDEHGEIDDSDYDSP